jgi:hypothetical protein
MRTMSLRSSVAGKPVQFVALAVSAFDFLLSILNVLFCSWLSHTCHNYIPYGTPMQHPHGAVVKPNNVK